MEILMFDYCFKKFQNSFKKKQRGASTFKCNAGRLLWRTKKKKKNNTDSQLQEIL